MARGLSAMSRDGRFDDLTQLVLALVVLADAVAAARTGERRQVQARAAAMAAGQLQDSLKMPSMLGVPHRVAFGRPTMTEHHSPGRR